MTSAYDKLYLGKARVALARMLDFSVHSLRYDIEKFYDAFLQTDVARRFGEGDPAVIAGRSGVEMAYIVLDETGKSYIQIEPEFSESRSPEYWTGWALAYYQWFTGMSFAEINKSISIGEIRDMYHPFHEMDIRQFCDRMNELYRQANPDTKLKQIRKNAGLSQRELADLTDIPLRTIQQYEQRQKNINHARMDYLVKMSDALGCEIDVLIERVPDV